MLWFRSAFLALLSGLTLCSDFVPAYAANPFTLEKTIDATGTTSGTQAYEWNVDRFDENILVGLPHLNTAYLLDFNTGARSLTLTSPDAVPGTFGSDVTQVGQYIAVADRTVTVGPTQQAGVVHLFDGESGAFLRSIHEPTLKDDGHFGIEMKSAGGRLFVNANQGYFSSGTVYAFDPNNGQLVGTISNPNLNVRGFGSTMDADEKSIFIGETGFTAVGSNDAASVYRYDAATLTQMLKIPDPASQVRDGFGNALAHNAAQLLVGAPAFTVTGHPQVGQAYLFNSDTGALLRTFSNPEPGSFVHFGYHVALLGNYAIIDAPETDNTPDQPGHVHSGAAYIFNINNGDYLGRIISLGAGGDNPSALSGLLTIGSRLLTSDGRSDVTGQVGNGVLDVYSVPEPGAMVSASIGFAVLSATAFRRRSMRRTRSSDR